jgi:hypothetical protein
MQHDGEMSEWAEAWLYIVYSTLATLALAPSSELLLFPPNGIPRTHLLPGHDPPVGIILGFLTNSKMVFQQAENQC